MKKSNIRVFGEISIAHVEKRGLFSYAVVRDFDKKVLAKSFSFRKYINDTIRTMYTGEYYATGDYILVADTVNGNKEINSMVEKKEEVSRCTGNCDNCPNYTESYFCGFATPYCKLQGKEITHNVY